jgi:alkylhydroperoxidase family enzyme
MPHIDPLPWEANPQFTAAEELKMLVSLVTSQASGCRYCQAHMTNLASL